MTPRLVCLPLLIMLQPILGAFPLWLQHGFPTRCLPTQVALLRQWSLASPLVGEHRRRSEDSKCKRFFRSPTAALPSIATTIVAHPSITTSGAPHVVISWRAFATGSVTFASPPC